MARIKKSSFRKTQKPKLRYAKTKRIGVKRMELVQTKQGMQIVDNTKLVKAIKRLDKVINTNFNWSNEDECKKAEEEFRDYMKKQGYTRF